MLAIFLVIPTSCKTTTVTTRKGQVFCATSQYHGKCYESIQVAYATSDEALQSCDENFEPRSSCSKRHL